MSAQNPLIKQIDGFTVTGLMVRTKNSDEFNPETAKLSKLWQQFFTSNPPTNTTIYGVYSDYESDASGSYKVTVGPLESAKSKAVKVNSGKYLVFQGKGAMPQTVIETWKQVWDYFSEENSSQRCYLTDFEEYKNGDEVAIYIGVK